MNRASSAERKIPLGYILILALAVSFFVFSGPAGAIGAKDLFICLALIFSLISFALFWKIGQGGLMAISLIMAIPAFLTLVLK